MWSPHSASTTSPCTGYTGLVPQWSNTRTHSAHHCVCVCTVFQLYLCLKHLQHCSWTLRIIRPLNEAMLSRKNLQNRRTVTGAEGFVPASPPPKIKKSALSALPQFPGGKDRCQKSLDTLPKINTAQHEGVCTDRYNPHTQLDRSDNQTNPFLLPVWSHFISPNFDLQWPPLYNPCGHPLQQPNPQHLNSELLTCTCVIHSQGWERMYLGSAAVCQGL